ncbi:MAG: lysophospholipid acyltransferase family protein [Planctomycetota bacterium]
MTRADTHPPDTPAVIPGRYDRGVARVFKLLTGRMVRKRFHALRLTPGSIDSLSALDRDDTPLIVAMTHASWWDPILGITLHTRLTPARTGCAPIDRDVLTNVGIFRRLGLFGIDPDDPRTLRVLVDYAAERLSTDARPTLWITPQGRFQDPRDAMVVRPGVAAIAARLGRVRVMALAAEMPFWDDQKPELLAHLAPIDPPGDTGSTRAWHRSIRDGLRGASDRLAELAIARDPAAFEVLLGSGSGRTIPFYDLYLSLTGRSTAAIRTRGLGDEAPPTTGRHA